VSERFTVQNNNNSTYGLLRQTMRTNVFIIMTIVKPIIRPPMEAPMVPPQSTRHNAMIAPKIPPAARAENKQLQKLEPNKTAIVSRETLFENKT
jgi:hypothetical protein